MLNSFLIFYHRNSFGSGFMNSTEIVKFCQFTLLIISISLLYHLLSRETWVEHTQNSFSHFPHSQQKTYRKKTLADCKHLRKSVGRKISYSTLVGDSSRQLICREHVCVCVCVCRGMYLVRNHFSFHLDR